jgi:hypothetical protein
MVDDVGGGTDAYYCDDADEINEVWSGEFDDPKCLRLEPLIRECVQIGHYWSFRRSMGQPGIVNLAYGLIAGSLAALTDGFYLLCRLSVGLGASARPTSRVL